MSYGVGRRRGLDPELLWLWCRAGSSSSHSTSSMGTSTCCRCSPKKKEKHPERQNGEHKTPWLMCQNTTGHTWEAGGLLLAVRPSAQASKIPLPPFGLLSTFPAPSLAVSTPTSLLFLKHLQGKKQTNPTHTHLTLSLLQTNLNMTYTHGFPFGSYFHIPDPAPASAGRRLPEA